MNPAAPTALHEVASPPVASDPSLRVLFLGNAYNPISIGCLAGLLESGLCRVSVGVYQPEAALTPKRIVKLIRLHGPLFLARKAGLLVAAALRVRLRRLGRRPHGFRSVAELACCHSFESFPIGKLNSRATVERIRTLAPDLIVVAAFSRILPPELIAVPPLGCINLHASLLPKYRGPNPFYWVLANRERRTGVTVHYIDAGIDTGEIIAQEEMPVDARDTEVSLRDRAIPVGARLLVEAVRMIRRGEAPRARQDEAEASYYPLPPRGASRL